MAKEAFISILETDLRLLSSESRKSDSLAGQLAGWLSNSEHPEVKEAAERAVLKLRAFSRQPDCIEAIQNSTVRRILLLVLPTEIEYCVRAIRRH